MRSVVVFRLVLLVAMMVLFAIRIRSSRKQTYDQGTVAVHEGPASQIAGAAASVIALVFGGEFLIAPGTFGFAYALAYPLWLRWVGAMLLVCGVALLGWAHGHLDRNFHALIVTRPHQVLIQSGPYRHIRHPIYLAYLMIHIGGGLLASNWVLTLVSSGAFAVLVWLRVPAEERILTATFGDRYERYKARTGALLPKL